MLVWPACMLEGVYAHVGVVSRGRVFKYVGGISKGSCLIPHPSSPSLLGTQRCLSEYITRACPSSSRMCGGDEAGCGCPDQRQDP